jgi:bifunctional non-homologous end joining protein LigD
MAPSRFRQMLCVPALPSLDPGIWRGSLRLTEASFVFSGHVSRVRIGRHDVSITNPDKVFFPEPGLTKGDLVEYYVDVAPCALNHIRRRLFHMKRYPNGVEGDFFHQKRVPPHPDYVGEQFVQFPSGHSTVFAVVDNPAALAWVVNLGCIELHTWHSRIDEIERPDYLLIDLDPSEGNPWEYVREIALVVREVMDELGLASFPKTSGATGMHILAPIKPELAFPEVRRFAKALAQEVERRVGDQDVATTTWKVADRRGVFVDFGQNARDRTIACAYSVRPTADARVSAPLRWDEVPRCDPSRFTVQTTRKRLDRVGDLTAGMWRRKASLLPRFAALDLPPGDPTIVEIRRSRRAQRWVSDQRGASGRSGRSRGAGA